MNTANEGTGEIEKYKEELELNDMTMETDENYLQLVSILKESLQTQKKMFEEMTMSFNKKLDDINQVVQDLVRNEKKRKMRDDGEREKKRRKAFDHFFEEKVRGLQENKDFNKKFEKQKLKMEWKNMVPEQKKKYQDFAIQEQDIKRNKLRKTLSPYQFFLRDERIKEQYPLDEKTSTADRNKFYSNLWKGLPQNERAKYEEESRKAKKSLQVRRPKKKLNSFSIFCQEKINEFKIDKNVPAKEYFKKAGAMWKKLSEEEKNVYKEKALKNLESQRGDLGLMTQDYSLGNISLDSSKLDTSNSMILENMNNGNLRKNEEMMENK